MTRAATLLLVFLAVGASAQRPQSGRTAEVVLAEAAAKRGDWSDATARASVIASAYATSNGSWPVADMIAVGRAYAVLGARDPKFFHDALQAFDRASAADSTNVESRLRAADLLLDKYNAPDAEETYSDVLRIAPGNARALLGMARSLSFRGDAKATAAVRKSLVADSTLVPARVLLAQLHLGAEAYDSATAQASQAIRYDSSSVASWAILGAIAWLRGDSVQYRSAKASAERAEPHSATFAAEIAEAAARQRRYADAVAMAQVAVTADSQSARAFGVLAENQLRTGAMFEGRSSLDRAFILDPYNLWHKNTLDLLDNVKKFRTVKTARFEIVAPADEAEYLGMYLGPLLEAAYDSFAVRYGYKPPTPIRVESYGRHADFSVRTVGLTGLGALGVCFGPVIILDSPKAQESGDLNYGSTAWHELAHTFTLGLSDFRVPRWISEGLSVLEERRTGRGWGSEVSPLFIAAYKGGVLPKASNINEGLVRPAFPAEIGLSYLEASLVMAMIEAEHGTASIRAMLKGFADGLDTRGVLKQVLSMTPDAFDQHFDGWLRTRYALAFAVIDSTDGIRNAQGTYVTLVRTGTELLAAGKSDSARVLFLRAEQLFPEDGSPDGPAGLLAHYYRDAGNIKAAVAQLHRVTMRNETAREANDVEATMNLSIGDSTAALAALDRQQWIGPYDVALHLRIAELSEKLGDVKRAVAERRALLALDPPDRLEARYQLARVLLRAGDKEAARREILVVLEQAPAFEKAQALLLELQGGHT